MNRSRAGVALWMLLVAAPSVTRPAAAQEPQHSERPPRLVLIDSVSANRIEEEIIDLVKRLWAAIGDRDSAQVAELIHPQALFVASGVRKDRSQIMADFAPWTGTNAWDPEDIGLRMSDYRVIVLSETAAVVNYLLEWDEVDPRFPHRMYDTGVWVKQDGEWKEVFAHDSVFEWREFMLSVTRDSSR